MVRYYRTQIFYHGFNFLHDTIAERLDGPRWDAHCHQQSFVKKGDLIKHKNIVISHLTLDCVVRKSWRVVTRPRWPSWQVQWVAASCCSPCPWSSTAGTVSWRYPTFQYDVNLRRSIPDKLCAQCPDQGSYSQCDGSISSLGSHESKGPPQFWTRRNESIVFVQVQRRKEMDEIEENLLLDTS